MSCKLNIKAPNGENSILFKDIAEAVSNPTDAIDTYFLTQTPAFKDKYTGKYDLNGEPRYNDFSKEAYVNDVDYTKIEMDHKAEVYKKLLTEVPKLIDIIEDKIDYLQTTTGKGKRENIKRMNEMLTVLTSEAINTSIPKFLEMSNLHVKNLKKKATEAFNDKDADIRELSSYYKISSSYGVVAEIKNDLIGSQEIADIFDTDIFEMNNTVEDISAIQAMYLEKSKDFLAEEFHKRDSTWSKRDIKKALNETSRDVIWTEQMLEYMGDSRDRVLSMVANIMMEAEHTIRRESVSFNKDLQGVLEKLESKYSGKTEEMFAQIILEDDSGAVHFIDPDIQFTNGENAFADKMYNQLQKAKGNQELMEFLLFYSDNMRTLDNMLPAKARMGTRLPSVLKSEFELFGGKSLKDKYDLLADNAKKKIQRSNLDMEYGLLLDSTGKPVKRIPTFYTQKYNSIDFDASFTRFLKENLDKGMNAFDAEGDAALRAEKESTTKMAKLISRDLASSLQAFHSMATNYAAKNELIQIFESAQDVVSSDARKYTLVDSGGRVVKNAISGRIETIGGTKSNAAKAIASFLNVQLYGQKEKDLGYFDVFGAKIDTNKGLRAINNATGFIQMTFNVLAGLGNIGNGEYNNIMESVGGEFYNKTNYAKASGFYKKNLGGIMNDIGSRTPNNIVNLIEEHYNMLQSYGGNNIKVTEASKSKRLLKTDSAFFIQGSGEHMMQIRAGLAVMDGTKVYNKDGTERGSLLDAHTQKDGKLIIDQGLFVKEKDGTLVAFDTNQQNRISNKIGAILRKLHGNYSSQTANAMQQDARLALVMKFRGWMYEGIKRRFGKKREYHMMESEAEGFYREGAKAAKILIRDLRKFQLTLSKENWANLSPTEKANIRRFITETSTIVLLGIAGAMLGKAGKLMEDEYDSDSFKDRLVLGSFGLLNYEVNRLYTEVFAYVNPVEAVKLMKSPMASTSLMENVIRLVGQTMTNPLEEYESGWRKGQLKVGAYAEKITPIYKQLATLNADGIKDRGMMFTN